MLSTLRLVCPRWHPFDLSLSASGDLSNYSQSRPEMSLRRVEDHVRRAKRDFLGTLTAVSGVFLAGMNFPIDVADPPKTGRVLALCKSHAQEAPVRVSSDGRMCNAHRNRNSSGILSTARC